MDLPDLGLELGSPALQVDSLPVEPQGKPKNNEVGSLSLFQWIFLTQESNQGLLHCRQILYQLSYQGNPFHMIKNIVDDICITKTSIKSKKIMYKQIYKYL